MKMRSVASLLLLLALAGHTYGLNCYICTDLDFDGEMGSAGNCFTVVTTGADATPTTPACTGTGTEYCTSTFMIRDGVVISAARACASTGTATTTVPGNQCTTSYDTNGNPTGTTTCVYTCTGNNCNSNATASFQTCTTDCNKPTTQGECNYIDGSCHCDSGYSGANCSTAVATTLRSCVQCSSETDATCETATASTPCVELAGGGPQLEYCSTTVSKIFDQADGVVKTVTVRGCTANFVATDQCSFSDVTTDPPINGVGYREFTCYSTCNTNGCNTNIANGVIGTGESVPLMCVQCSDTNGDGTCDSVTTRTPCASGSTHCKSTVTYMISEKVDLSYVGAFSDAVAYQLRSMVRECVSEEVTTGCTETTIAALDGVKKVICTETCQEDGCNVGWPARPNCIQCITGPIDEYDECLENPTEARMCTYPYQQYCVIMDRGIQKGVRASIQGYPRRITRGCSHINIGTACTVMKYRECEVENCNRTCTTDGCNVGSGSSMAIQTMVAVVVPAILGWLAQSHL